jgi:hypothetical protein
MPEHYFTSHQAFIPYRIMMSCLAVAAVVLFHRIEFLSQVRNMALALLYSRYASSSSSTLSGSDSSRPAAPGAVPWDPDYVVFVNDVFFCWSMVLRLMNYRADITCGLDFMWGGKFFACK